MVDVSKSVLKSKIAYVDHVKDLANPHPSSSCYLNIGRRMGLIYYHLV